MAQIYGFAFYYPNIFRKKNNRFMKIFCSKKNNAYICVFVTIKNFYPMYCFNCGNEVSEKAVICVKCGVSLKSASAEVTRDGKDWLTTLLLCWFLGVLGVHSFYTQKTAIGIAQLLTLGGCGIWALVDFIMILTDSFKDGNGNKLIKR